MEYYLEFHLDFLSLIFFLIKMKKKISILGSTGSIGLTTLKIIDKKKNFFKPLYLLSANKNYKLICKQIKKYKPKYFLINDKKFI